MFKKCWKILFLLYFYFILSTIQKLEDISFFKFFFIYDIFSYADLFDQK